MYQQLVELLGQPNKTFSEEQASWWTNVSAEKLEKAKSIYPKLNIEGVYVNPSRIKGGQIYDIGYVPEKEKLKTLEESVKEFIEVNPGCTHLAVSACLQHKFPACHFSTYLDHLSNQRQITRINVFSPKTDNLPKRLVTLYFPVGSYLSL